MKKKTNGKAKRTLLRNMWTTPDGPVVKNLPCNTGDAGVITSLEAKISHSVEQQRLGTASESPCATTRSLHDATKIRHSQTHKQTNDYWDKKKLRKGAEHTIKNFKPIF